MTISTPCCRCCRTCCQCCSCGSRSGGRRDMNCFQGFLRTTLKMCCCLQMLLPRALRDQILKSGRGRGEDEHYDEDYDTGEDDVEERYAYGDYEFRPLPSYNPTRWPARVQTQPHRSTQDEEDDRRRLLSSSPSPSTLGLDQGCLTPSLSEPSAPPPTTSTTTKEEVHERLSYEHEEMDKENIHPNKVSSSSSWHDMDRHECVICLDEFTPDNPEMHTLCSCGENRCRFHYPCLLMYLERSQPMTRPTCGASGLCPTCRGPLYFEEMMA